MNMNIFKKFKQLLGIDGLSSTDSLILQSKLMTSIPFQERPIEFIELLLEKEYIKYPDYVEILNEELAIRKKYA